jgi:hypothetical protein
MLSFVSSPCRRPAVAASRLHGTHKPLWIMLSTEYMGPLTVFSSSRQRHLGGVFTLTTVLLFERLLPCVFPLVCASLLPSPLACPVCPLSSFQNLLLQWRRRPTPWRLTASCLRESVCV